MTRIHKTLFCTLRLTTVGLLLGSALTGCTDARRALGYEKIAPDEFRVVSHAPLSTPPDFSLRPPAPGAVRPQEGATRDQARQALVGGADIPTPSRVSAAGDAALLRQAGAGTALPDIRNQVNKETLALVEGGKTLSDSLIFWRKPVTADAGEQLDAAKEAERLQENQRSGRPVTSGDTPRIVRYRKGMLEGIFD